MTRLDLARLTRVAALVAAVAACADLNEPPADTPSQYITMRRAWLPGERDSLIARIIRTRAFGGVPNVGDISDLAPEIFSDPDSVVVIVPNPAFTAHVATAALGAPSVAALMMPPAFDSTWTIFGLDIRNIDNTQAPADTADWLGTFWAKYGEETWKDRKSVV